MSLFIGIDSGTQSTKAIVLDLESGKVVAEARASYQLIPNLPVGHMEQHPSPGSKRSTRSSSPSSRKSTARPSPASASPASSTASCRSTKTAMSSAPPSSGATPPQCPSARRSPKKLAGPKATLKKTGNLVLAGFRGQDRLVEEEGADYRRLRHVLLPHD